MVGSTFSLFRVCFRSRKDCGVECMSWQKGGSLPRDRPLRASNSCKDAVELTIVDTELSKDSECTSVMCSPG